MRSNIACTWFSGRVPELMASFLLVLGLQGCDVVDELVELLGVLLLQRLEARHGRRGVDERPRDGVGAEPVADVGQRWPERVAVLADLVAAQTAGRSSDLLPLLKLRRGGELDLRRRPG